jgi:hypothetical protein
MAVTAPDPVQGTGTTPIDSYSKYYRDTKCTKCCVNPTYVIREFEVAEDRTTKTGQQLLYEDIPVTRNDMWPHAYVMLIKDESWLVMLHHASHLATPLGTTPEP